MTSNRNIVGRLLPLMVALCATVAGVATLPAQASSHREALAILNEPCADNTDTYAWVSPGAHNKLYLIMDFNRFTSRVRATKVCVPATATSISSISESARASKTD